VNGNTVRSLRFLLSLVVLVGAASGALAAALSEELLVNGNAEAGQLLVATAQFDAAIAVSQANYHWYRLAPGQRSWVLIESAQGTTYVPAAIDIGQQVMVVAVVNQNGTVRRVSSTPIGPIRAAAQ
jgi:hypothetical protein